MKQQPKTTIAAACVIAWAINASLVSRMGERLLSTAIRLAFELLGGNDMFVGIG